MKRAILLLKKHTVASKIILARSIAEQMTAHSSYFPSPNPGLNEVESKAAELEAAYQLTQDGSRSARVIMKAREKELNTLLIQLSNYVSNVAAGDSEIINRAGMGVGTIGGPAQAALRPDNLRLKDAHTSGSIKALWKKDKNAKAYMVYIALAQTSDTSHPVSSGWSAPPGSLSALPQPPVQPGTTGYILYDVCLTSKLIISGLQPGTKVWVTVLALSAAGKSDFSDPAVIIAR